MAAAERLILFSPEQWGQFAVFSRFYPHTYSLKSLERRAVDGVGQHLKKARILSDAVVALGPTIGFDKDELDQKGFTTATRSAMVSVLTESAITEIYSSVDCTAKVIRAIYGNKSRGFKDSTRGLFERPYSITGALPDDIKNCLRSADWFVPLLRLRDELTHYSTGNVSVGNGVGSIQYSHRGVKEGGVVFAVDDVVAWLFAMLERVGAFVDEIFRNLNSTLCDVKILQPCGIVDGHVLHRYVSPVGRLTFNSGNCGAWVWFEKDGYPTCPFKEKCGAYEKKARVGEGDPPPFIE